VDRDVTELEVERASEWEVETTEEVEPEEGRKSRLSSLAGSASGETLLLVRPSSPRVTEPARALLMRPSLW
jgi:hypothetical protein